MSLSELSKVAILGTCAVYNAILAPKSYSAGFVVGLTCGLLVATQRRIEFVVNKIIQSLAQQVEASAGKSTTYAAEVVKGKLMESAAKTSPAVGLAFKILLCFFPVAKAVVVTAEKISLLSEEQKKLKQDLRPIPGWKGLTLSLAAATVHVKEAAYPALTSLRLPFEVPAIATRVAAAGAPVIPFIGMLSGLSPGYNVGFYLIDKIPYGK